MAIKRIINLSVALCSICFATIGYTQPRLPIETIPLNIPKDVRQEIEKLYSGNPLERGYAALHLGEMGEKAAPAAPFLLSMLYDNTSLQWGNWGGAGFGTSPGQIAADALCKIGNLTAIRSLINSLHDPDSNVRRHSAIALSCTKDDRVVDSLIPVLADKDSYVRISAAEALGNIKNPRAVFPLIAALKDDWKDVRIKAAVSLAKIEDKRAVGPLIAFLEEGNNSQYQNDVVRALENMTGKDYGNNPLKWLTWWEDTKNRFPFSR